MAQVYGAHGELITTNKGKSEEDWLQDFKFLYKKSYGNLYVTITNGPGVGGEYTISVTFPPSQWAATPTLNGLRYSPTNEEIAMSLAFKMEMERRGEEIIPLVQVFKLELPGNVTTNELQHFQMDYCFTPGGPYSLTVNTVANDDRSAFATYVCPLHVQQQHGGKCVVQTPYKDLSGSATNFVRVPINVTDFGPVKAIVKGAGRYKQGNTFIISASRYFKGLKF